MKAISIGIAKTILNGLDLGSATTATVDIQPEIITRHYNQVGTAYLVGSEQQLKRYSGSLSVTTEEISLLKPVLDGMRTSIMGLPTTTIPFDCQFPLSGGSISGTTMPIPQFSITASFDNWTTITINPIIVGTPDIQKGTISNTKLVGGLPWLDVKNKGALTVDRNNLSCVTKCNGLILGDLSLNISSQITPVYRQDNPWPIDYVIESVKISADMGIIDYSTIEDIKTGSPILIDLIDINKRVTTFDLGVGCLVTSSGIKTSMANLNTWRLKVEGTYF